MKQKIEKQTTGYTLVINTLLNDNRLSAKAKGVYAYLYSKPDEWDFSGDRVAVDFKDGRKAVYAALKELEDTGWIERRRQPDGNMTYFIKVKPNAQMGQEDTDPNAQNGKEPKWQRAEMGSISKKEYINKKEEDSKTKYGELGKVLLTPNEYMTLVERLGEPATQGLIWELDTYIASTGKKYQSHYATLLSWARRRVQERKQVKRKSI